MTTPLDQSQKDVEAFIAFAGTIRQDPRIIQAENIARELSLLRKKNAAYETTLDDAVKKKESLSKELNETRSQLRALQEQRVQLQQEKKKLGKELHETKALVERQERDLGEKEERVAELGRLRVELTSETTKNMYVLCGYNSSPP